MKERVPITLCIAALFLKEALGQYNIPTYYGETFLPPILNGSNLKNTTDDLSIDNISTITDVSQEINVTEGLTTVPKITLASVSMDRINSGKESEDTSVTLQTDLLHDSAESSTLNSISNLSEIDNTDEKNTQTIRPKTSSVLSTEMKVSPNKGTYFLSSPKVTTTPVNFEIISTQFLDGSLSSKKSELLIAESDTTTIIATENTPAEDEIKTTTTEKQGAEKMRPESEPMETKLYYFENNISTKQKSNGNEFHNTVTKTTNEPESSSATNNQSLKDTSDHAPIYIKPNKEIDGAMGDVTAGYGEILHDDAATAVNKVKDANEEEHQGKNKYNDVAVDVTTSQPNRVTFEIFGDDKNAFGKRGSSSYPQRKNISEEGLKLIDDVEVEYEAGIISKMENKDEEFPNVFKPISDIKKTIGIMVSGAEKATIDETVDISNNESIIRDSSINTKDVGSSAVVNEFLTKNESSLDSNKNAVPSAENVDPISTEVDPTRVPKKIQNDYERSYDGRSRPARPDPGYHSYNQEFDYSRPYRPDSPSFERPYFRPTPDYRTPLIRQDPDYTRPSRPDQDTRRTSYRPEFGNPKPPVVDSDHGRHTSYESGFARPYRPSAARPYRPQGSFSKPYHPDFHRPSEHLSFAKPDYFGSSKPDTHETSLHQSDPVDSEHSRDDFEYTRQADANVDYTKTIPEDSRPSSHSTSIKQPIRQSNTDSKKTLSTSHDLSVEETGYKTSRPASIDTRLKPTSETDSPFYKTSVSSIQSQNLDTTKPTKNMNSVPTGGSYPRPGFGSNYGEKPASTSLPFALSSSMVSMRNLTRVEIIKADCFDNHMKVSVRFNGSFDGLIYSSGYSHDSTCNYINGSGRYQYEFFIRLNRCGTLGQHEVPDPTALNAARRRQERAQYLVNTVTVQYNPMIEEDIDEHFRVTCEYGYDFWKTVTFPIINVESSAVKVRQGSPVVFTLPPPQCNMEIRSGYGPTGNRISGPVNVGDPLSLVIHMKSETPGFDILVSNCVAHNGAKKRLQLIDANGCVVQDKLVSPFRGVSSPDRTQQLTLYSYLKAFRFTGSPALYIECDVHMCHGSCPPQRCYWRHLYKRSIENLTTPLPIRDTEGVVSESVSLFQALEVRHDEVDVPNPIALWKKGLKEDEDNICMKKAGFAAMFSSLLVLLVLSCTLSIILCSRIRRMKRYVEAPSTNFFSEFDCHIRR